MSDGVKQTPILICMPYSMVHVASGNVVKALCAICHGEVFYNAATGLPTGAHTVMPVCGSCAVDLIDADGEKHEFGLTEPQAEGRGGVNPLVRELVRAMGMDKMSRMALDTIRANKARYDASGGVGGDTKGAKGAN